MEDRLERLEIKVAYQEDALQQLNDAILAQQAVIDALKQICAALGERLGALDAGGAPATPDDRPPHY